MAAGRLDLEALADPELPEHELTEALLALPGIGPYATAHMLLVLGRSSSLVLDAWTRPTYARLVGRKRVADRTIERRFRRYREHAGLAFWLLLTRDWVPGAEPPGSRLTACPRAGLIYLAGPERHRAAERRTRMRMTERSVAGT